MVVVGTKTDLEEERTQDAANWAQAQNGQQCILYLCI